MGITKETAKAEVLKLVNQFREFSESYLDSGYNEEKTRIHFVNPFFKALGWDVDNSDGMPEAYRDVIHIDRLKEKGQTTKAPDYCFTIFGHKKFFVEAKKPSVDILHDIKPAYQIRRYGWSAKFPISILTDFEEFAVYDCTLLPKATDKASAARLKYFKYDKYDENFDYIWDNFSKQSVLKGSLEKYAKDETKKRGSTSVDQAFLDSLISWRMLLAENIAVRNKTFTLDEITYVVQQTLDRLVFLRICEDRNIEVYGTLKSCCKGPHAYKNLFAYFEQADKRYNSGLFDLTNDTLSSCVDIDDKVVKSIIGEMYYPECPYEFSQIPVEILGNAYEKFLGSVLYFESGRKAKYKIKPEVQKAGGVYYTPEYIVDAIVSNCLSPMLQGKNIKQISALKFVDPACGSGSFLLGIYRFLLRWHAQYYLDMKIDSKKKNSPITPEGQLSTEEKKRILLTHIYGVDIDEQAVEVTKLSLLLKCLEGESSASIEHQFVLFNKRVLPTLDKNIKSGNSIVDYDVVEPNSEFDLGFSRPRVAQPFSWEHEFPEIFQNGGFDAVLGNPPYVFGRDWKDLGIPEELKKYFSKTYKSSPYQLDMFSIFMEKSVRLAKESGQVGLIVPNVWLTNSYSAITRKYIFDNAKWVKLINTEEKVFPGLTVDTVIFIMQKSKSALEGISTQKISKFTIGECIDLSVSDYQNGEQPISLEIHGDKKQLVDCIRQAPFILEQIAKITRGVHPYRLGGFGESAFENGPQTARDVEERPYNHSTLKKGYRPFIYGRDLNRFATVDATDFIKYGVWLAEPRNPEFFEGLRIYSRKILGDRLVLTIDDTDSVTDQQVYITKVTNPSIDTYWLAGVLGSKVVAWYIKNYFDEGSDAFPQIKVGQLKSLPIPNPKTHANLTSKISGEVQQLIAANNQVKTMTDKSKIAKAKSWIAHLESEIDKSVLEQFGAISFLEIINQ